MKLGKNELYWGKLEKRKLASPRYGQTFKMGM